MNDATTPTWCLICPRRLLGHETGRYICLPCEHRIDADLRKLAGPSGLYARLCLRIQPGRASDGPAVSGTPGRGVPANLEILSATANGGIVSTLETWVEDWATYGLATIGVGGRLQHRVDTAITTLRLNLTRAASRHPAIDEFAGEIFKVRARAENLITGERAARTIPVICPCGTVTSITLNSDGFECRNCEAEYGHTAAMHLPLAERRAA